MSRWMRPFIVRLSVSMPGSVQAQTFAEVGASAGVNDGANGRGTAWGDYDNDGDLDLYAANFNSANILYRNNNNGTFTEVGASAGVNDGGAGDGVAWGDYDNDGDLDLFVANRGAGLLYQNSNNGTFTQVGSSAGTNSSGNSHGATWGDYDSDGDQDLYVTDPGNANWLYQNNGIGTFTQVTSSAGVNYTGGGQAVGAAWGDYDNDGDQDLSVAVASGADLLYRNNNNGTFTEVGASAGVNDGGTGQGVAWGDYDNDGDQDLYLANSGGANRLYQNNNNGTFTEVGSSAGVNDGGNGVGVAWADYDNDGDQDLYLGNSGSANRLYQNSGNSNRWLAVKLVGSANNKSGIGARVTAVTGSTRQRRDLDGGSGYLSQPSLPVEFGFGSTTTVDSLIVRWPNGTVRVQTGVATNQVLTATEAEPAISLSATSVSAGNVNVGSSGTATFTVGNTGNATLSVTGVTVSGTDVAQFTVTPTSFAINAGAAAQTVTVTFTPTSTGSKSASLSIAHNASGSPSAVTLSGTGTAPAISLSATSVSVGTVTKTASGTATFTVTNSGNATLSVSNITSSNSQFTVSPTSFNLSASASQTVTVTFAPTKAGWEQGTLTISHNASGGSSIVTTSGIGRVNPPSGSLSNTKIAFYSLRDGNYEVYSMRADGANQTRLTNNAVDERPNSWSPDGTKIAFQSSGEIYVMNADGTSQTNLTNNAAADQSASWSPDGTKITFVSTRDSNAEIYVMNADGTSQTRLTNNSAADDWPSWVPDGTKIAFVAERDGNREIYVMNADGTSQTRLTTDGASDYWPAWSPDGTKIAFGSYRNGGQVDIYVMNADGTSQTRLTTDGAHDTGPTWSPDGTKIAFETTRNGAGTATIYTMNPDGTGQVQLISTLSDGYPAWSGFITTPSITLSATSVSSGSVNIGSPGTATFAITNSGGGTLSVSGITVSGTDAAQFSVSPTTASLTAGASQTITVTFTPTSSGTKSASLSIAHNASGSPSSVALGGTGVNTAPTISDIANQIINEDAATSALAFTVGDAETAAASLTVSGVSSNPTLMPVANIVFGGSGANRTVAITPAANQAGTATITLTVSDGSLSASDTITLTVTAINDAPTLSAISNPAPISEDVGIQTVNLSGIGAGENETQVLTVTATSSNTALIPNPAVSYTSPNTTGSLSYTPLANASGSATITVTVTDDGGTVNGGVNTVSQSLTMTVTAINDAPTITDITNQTINEDVATSTLAFTVGDVETAVASLTVSGSSSNTALVPVANMVFGGSGASRTVTVTPAANQSGSATITVSVSDGSLSASDSFALTVNSVNDAPTLAAISNPAPINEDAGTQTIALSGISAGGNETQVLTVTATSSNAALIPNPTVSYTSPNATGSLSYTSVANASGSATITVAVTDDGGTANGGVNTTSQSFTVTVNAVNDIPTISDIANQIINEDAATSALPFTVGDAETAAASLTVTSSSSNPALVPSASIVFGGSGASRTVTITPAVNQAGNATITITVSDGSLSASDTFTLTVTAINDAPTISDIANQTVNEDVATSALAFTVGDAETAAASLTVSGASSNSTLVPAANITFGGSGASRTVMVTSAVNQSGTATITITVSDGSLSASDTFTLTVNAVNDAPTISDLANASTKNNTPTAALEFTVGDAETAAASLTVTSSSSNPALVPAANIAFGGSGANRTVTITPAANRSGTATITLTVSDGTLTASDTFGLTVSDNAPPTLTDIADQIISEDGQTSSLAFTVGDEETAAASLTVSGASSNPALIPASGIAFGGSGASRSVRVTPAANQSGTATISLTVSDGSATTSKGFLLTVSAVNDAPTITDIANQTVTEDTPTLPLSFKVKDLETSAGNLVLSKSSSDTALVPLANMVFSGADSNRTVVVTPGLNQSGSTTLTVTVSDGSLSASDSFTLTVNPVNDPPVLSPIGPKSVNEGELLTFTLSASDAEVDALTYTLSNAPTGALLAGATFTWTPTFEQAGSYNPTFVASDGKGGAASETVVITVNNATPPVWTPSPLAWNFGDVPAGSRAERTFYLKNPGNVAARIDSLVSNTRVFAVISPSFPRSVAGKDSVGVGVRFSPATGVREVQEGVLRVYSSLGPAEVRVAGRGVWVGLAVSPEEIDFGRVRPNSSNSSTLTVSNPGNLRLEVSATAMSNPVFSVSPRTFTVEGGSSRELTVTFTPTQGRVEQGTLTLSGNADSTKVVRLRGQGGEGPSLVLVPPSLNFGVVRVDSARVGLVRIKNGGGDTLKITSLSGLEPPFSVSPTQVPALVAGDSTLVRLRFAPTARGNFSGALSITLNDGNQQQVAVTGKGVRPEASLPLRLDFNRVAVGSAGELNLVVTNVGDDTLRVLSVLSDKPRVFNVTGGFPIAVAPNAAQGIGVRFTPQVVGKDSSELTLSTNAGLPQRVRVVGTGEDVAAAEVTVRLVPAEFGSVKVGEKKTAKLVAINRSRSSVTINSLQISPVGAPVRVASGALPRTLRQRDSLEVATLEFAPTTAGLFSGTLRVKGRGVEQFIILSGTGAQVVASPPALSYSPADTLRFGVVGPNQSELKPVEIRNTGSGTLKVVLRSESEEFVPEERDTIRVEASQSYSALIRFKPARTGTRRANLLISSNDPQQPLATLVLQGGGGGLYFDPPSIVFGEVEVGVRKDTTVVLFNQTASALTVRLSLPTGDFSVDRRSARIDVGKSVVLRISYRPSRTGQRVVRLEVQGRDLGLELTGTGVVEPVAPAAEGLQVSTTALAMGNTRVRQTSRKTLTLTNSGTQSLSVTLALSGPHANQFRVVPTRPTLTPGQRRSFTVIFAPISTGAKRATLTLTPSPGTPLTVALSGTAIAATASGLSAREEAAKLVGNTAVQFDLGTNYPNPFNPTTHIPYQLPEQTSVRLAIYDLLGQQVRTLAEGRQPAGYYQIVWDSRDDHGQPLSSGVYIYRLEAGAFVQTRKMLLVR